MEGNVSNQRMAMDYVSKKWSSVMNSCCMGEYQATAFVEPKVLQCKFNSKYWFMHLYTPIWVHQINCNFRVYPKADRTKDLKDTVKFLGYQDSSIKILCFNNLPCRTNKQEKIK